jgi:predicted HD phosphohydrolase
MNRRARFTRMDESTKDDWAIILPQAKEAAKSLPERVLAHLRLLEGEFTGFPVDRLTHCLQTATLAWSDGRDAEYVVCALLHDIGDTLGGFNHAAIAAAMLKPYVGEGNLWMVQHHAVFQSHHYFHHIGLDRNLRDTLKSSPYYDLTEEFVDRYDNLAFDPNREAMPLSAFEPMVRRLMAEPKFITHGNGQRLDQKS